MTIGETIQRRGCVTLYKFLAGKSLPELEKLIGYQSGRLAQGAFFVRMRPGQSVQPSDVQLLGYSQVAEHKGKSQFADTMAHFDLSRLTKMAVGYWQQEGLQNIVKVLPQIDHDNTLDNDIQYPPGLGIPQWKLTRAFDFEVTRFIDVNQRLS